MLVGNIEDSRAGFQYFRRLCRVHQPFNGAIDNEACLLQRGDNRRKPLNRYAGAGGADRNNLSVARCRYDDVERFGAHPQQGKLSQVNVERARLRFRKDRSGVAGLDCATFEDLAERVDPFRFDAIRQHILSPIQTLHRIRPPEIRAAERTLTPATGR